MNKTNKLSILFAAALMLAAFAGNALATDGSDFDGTFTKDFGETGIAGCCDRSRPRR